MIKAIQTSYKGYRFRSRLEARWAVFLDKLGMQWEYEPEGFHLPNGEMYLPDFHLIGKDTNGDKIDSWLEIKPDNVEISAKEMAKVQCFADHVEVGYMGGVFLCQGLPRWTTYKDLKSGFNFFLWSWRRRQWMIVNDDDIACAFGYPYQYSGGFPAWDMTRAIEASKSARFEHGERHAS